MTLLFENDMFRVSQKFFGGWKVVFKPTGTLLQPDEQTLYQIGLVWKIVRSKEYRSKSPPPPAAENMMFNMFAMTCLDPSSDIGLDFKSRPPSDVAAAIVMATRREAGLFD